MRAAPLDDTIDTEDEAQPPAIGPQRSGQRHAQTAAVGSRASRAVHVGVAPAQVEIERTAQSRAQEAAAATRAARQIWRLGGRSDP